MSLSIFLLASVASYLVVAFICVAAAGVAGIAAFAFLRAKNREGFDKALTPAASGEPSTGLGEMRELTSRIEDIVTQQQDNGETQRAHLSRKIDGIRESVESQHHAVTGLRQELRHEVKRRDQEMLEIRTQIESVREGIGLPAATRAALPPGPSAADLGAPDTQATMTPIALDAVPDTPEAAGEDDEGSGDSGPESGLFASMSFGEASGETASEDASPFGPMDFAFDEDDAADMDAPETDAPDSLFAPMAFEAETPALPTLDPDAPMALSFIDDDGFEPLAPLPTDAAPSMFEEHVPEAAPEAAPEPTAEITPAELTPMAFAFDDEEPPAPEAETAASPFEVVSFLEPESLAAAEPTPAPEPAPHTQVSEVDEETLAPRAEAPPAAAPEATARPAVPRPPVFEPAQREASGVAAGHSSAGESAFPPMSFEPPVVEEAPEPTPTAWIARPDREPGTPVETIGGIQVERVGDVPPAETPEASAPAPSPLTAPISGLEPVSFDAPLPTPEPVLSIPEPSISEPSPEPAPTEANVPFAEPAAAAEPAAPEPAAAAEPDEFPSPVVASDLADETSFDFGLDIEAELAAMGAEPLDLPSMTGYQPDDAALSDAAPDEPTDAAPPTPVAPEPLAPTSAAPEAARIRNAPVPPLRREASAEPAPEPVSEPEPAQPPAAAAPHDPTMPVPTPFDASEFVSLPPTPGATPKASPAPSAPAASAPAPTPPPPATTAPEPAAPEASGEEVPPYEAPEGAEDLTVITSIDADVQRALHMAGVLSLDDIARWGRTDARKISAEVGVSETTIMNQWIFEAQAALFDRYSSR